MWSNEEIGAALDGFGIASHRELLAGFAGDYWAGLRGLWEDFPIEIAGRLVSGLFPPVLEVDPTLAAPEQPVPAAAHAWLARQTDAPAALRRLVVEHADAAERAVRAQQSVLALLGAGNG